MTLAKLLNNLDSLKIKKVKGKNLWRVIDLNTAEKWSYIAEFESKKDAEDFRWRRAHH